jgi:SRSO17 transposase
VPARYGRSDRSGDRKIIQLIATRLGMRSHDARCGSLSATSWEAERPAAEPLVQADRLVGGPEAALVVDDTGLPKKRTASVGVVPRYATVLGPNANCRTPVSLAPAPDAQPLRLKEPT